MLFAIVLCCIVLYWIVLICIVLYYIVFYCSVLHFILLYFTLHTLLYFTDPNPIPIPIPIPIRIPIPIFISTALERDPSRINEVSRDGISALHLGIMKDVHFIALEGTGSFWLSTILVLSHY